MNIRGIITAVTGIIGFVVVDTLITEIITGTDTGSVLVQSIVRVVMAAGIALAVIKYM